MSCYDSEPKKIQTERRTLTAGSYVKMVLWLVGWWGGALVHHTLAGNNAWLASRPLLFIMALLEASGLGGAPG